MRRSFSSAYGPWRDTTDDNDNDADLLLLARRSERKRSDQAAHHEVLNPTKR